MGRGSVPDPGQCLPRVSSSYVSEIVRGCTQEMHSNPYSHDTITGLACQITASLGSGSFCCAVKENAARHTGEGRCPDMGMAKTHRWVPAYAGTTRAKLTHYPSLGTGLTGLMPFRHGPESSGEQVYSVSGHRLLLVQRIDLFSAATAN